MSGKACAKKILNCSNEAQCALGTAVLTVAEDPEAGSENVQLAKKAEDLMRKLQKLGEEALDVFERS